MSDWLLVCPTRPMRPSLLWDVMFRMVEDEEPSRPASPPPPPPPPSAQDKTPALTAQTREIAWLLAELGDELRALRAGLQDCYRLLAPAGRGNTLVVSTPRNEILKGHVTRLGSRIVKGTIHLKLRTLPAQTLTINPDDPLTIHPLDALDTHLKRSIELLDFTLAYAFPQSATDGPATDASGTAALPAMPKPHPPAHPHPKTEVFLSAQMRVLAQALADAVTLLRGPAPVTAADPRWRTLSAAPGHFAPPLPPHISFYMGLQESQLVLWLRALEPAGVPVNFGMKFALALGTARRLEHDEAEQVFDYCCEDGTAKGLYAPPPPTPPSEDDSSGGAGRGARTGGSSIATPGALQETGPTDVYVREKVRVESADPSLLSLYAKLNALSHSLLHSRMNLATAMDEELDE